MKESGKMIQEEMVRYQIERRGVSDERVLEARAANTVRELNYSNISIRHGDGFYGWAEAAPFDTIVVTAAADYIPPPLISQLTEGGRLIIPLGPPSFAQDLMLAEKRAGEIVVREMLPVRFVPLTGKH